MTSPDGTVDYGYDGTNQLTSEIITPTTGTATNVVYAYDDNGNRESVTVNGSATTYTPGTNNELTAQGNFTYEHDGEGNRTKRTETDGQGSVIGVVTYEWDHRNRLVRVSEFPNDTATDPDKTVEYANDPLNRRVARRVDDDGAGPNASVDTYFLNEGDRAARDGAGDHVVVQLDDNGDITNRYLHGAAIDLVLADEDDAGDILWPLTDNLGSVRDLAEYDAATDETDVVNHIVNDAFGVVTSESNAAVDHLFGYTGREFDDEVDLQYNRARYYDATVGRWISPDPIGFQAADANLYRYVGNHGTYASDPSGLKDPVLRAVHSSTSTIQCHHGGCGPSGLGPDLSNFRSPLTPEEIAYRAMIDEVNQGVREIFNGPGLPDELIQSMHSDGALQILGRNLTMKSLQHAVVPLPNGQSLVLGRGWTNPPLGVFGEAQTIWRGLRIYPADTKVTLERIFEDNASINDADRDARVRSQFEMLPLGTLATKLASGEQIDAYTALATAGDLTMFASAYTRAARVVGTTRKVVLAGDITANSALAVWSGYEAMDAIREGNYGQGGIGALSNLLRLTSVHLSAKELVNASAVASLSRAAANGTVIDPISVDQFLQAGGQSLSPSQRSFLARLAKEYPAGNPAVNMATKGSKYTEPSLPDHTITNENGVRIEHYTRGNDHPPAHAHVYGEGRSTRIGANGKPLSGDPELSPAQKKVIERNKAEIRKAINKIRKWWKWNNHLEEGS